MTEWQTISLDASSRSAGVRPVTRPFWPRDRVDRWACGYLAFLNVALLAVIGLRIYLTGV